MRTDLRTLRAPARLPLAALLAGALLGPAATLAAQAPAAPPAPAPGVPGVPSSGDHVFTGDRTVAEDEVLEDIVVVGGDLRVRGRVTGDAIVVGGNLILESTGVVLGDGVVTGGSILDEGGEIRGEMRTLDGASGNDEDAMGGMMRAGRDMDDVGDEIEREVEREVNRAVSRESRWFDPIREGLGTLFSTLALGMVLAGIGAALIFYGRPYLETVSDTLRASTARSVGVGLAAAFLIVPAFVVMVVALAVSIVGIPLLLAAVPLYPLAIAAAVAMGLLAAAHAIGERTAEQQGRGYDRRWSNSYAYLFTGLAMMLAPLVAAGLVEMTGFLGFLGGLLKFVTFAVLWMVATAGFGAVILSRAGTRRGFVPAPPLEPLVSDSIFDDEFARRPHG